ncbi:RmlC-like cupin domain superfamily [Arabidopsis suecica]|uniref:RmlC-like cupin domain superfamily n=1 Tax=Arabidopsis suecica TaxID=45249 RepID=A0A8T1ZH51_ARASU|nr:RmlC-like cupin domain superfamily [Arabidopsis suecica]
MGNSKETILSLLSSEILIENHGVKILSQVSDTKLAQLDYTSWTKWEGDPSTFPWTFENTETIYFVEGKVKVNVDGHEKEEEAFEIGKGDVVVFPKNMKCVWNITESVKKYFIHEEL